MTLDLLRFMTAGSVDDGKSTLIGRLLYDSKQVLDDQLEHVAEIAHRRGEIELDLALLTDGLRAEREQGITIDVAYRYFKTAARRFIIADCPGHQQYTRNMVTGASTADLAIVLLDARKGALEQSKRHVFISALLGIPHVVVAVNKMDLVDYDQDCFERIVEEFAPFIEMLGVRDCVEIPISALKGDNVVNRSQRMLWYDGPPLLTHLEHVDVSDDHPHGGAGAVPGPVGRPHRGQPRRVPRLRRTARERLAARRRGGARSAGRRADADRGDRHLRRRAPAGRGAAVNHAAPRGRPRRRARGDDLHGRQASDGHARVRRRRVLAHERARCARAGATSSSTRHAARSRGSRSSSTASTSRRLRASPGRASLHSTTSVA